MADDYRGAVNKGNQGFNGMPFVRLDAGEWVGKVNVHRVCVCVWMNEDMRQELRAARRATEGNIRNPITIVDKMFPKNENTFKPSHKPSKHKGFPSRTESQNRSKTAREASQ